MDKENVVHIYTMEYLFNHKEERNYVICRKMDGTGDHGRLNKPDSERQLSYFLSYVGSRFKERCESRRRTICEGSRKGNEDKIE
jgi:hypothetical protein